MKAPFKLALLFWVTGYVTPWDSPHKQVFSVKLLKLDKGHTRRDTAGGVSGNERDATEGGAECCLTLQHACLCVRGLIHEEMSSFKSRLEAWVPAGADVKRTGNMFLIWPAGGALAQALKAHTDKSSCNSWNCLCSTLRLWAAPISWSQTSRFNLRTVSRWCAPHWAAACLHVRLPVVQDFSNWFEAAGGPVEGDWVH